ncbi:hypothetical protein [Nocardia arizonensis]|uniref:hypothetical protein n=1 Tax=Nocardia arizonensis TaxID=1141647 RepID=UPI0006D283E4|nr:hypothetical protein [Nocardia arizonensis]
MRTYFEPEDTEAFEAAKELLTRRCTAWAAERGHSVDPFVLAAAMDFRHHSIDGRLGYWTAALAEEFLLSHAPRRLSISAQDALGVPDSLRLLVAYLHSTGLADPTGDTSVEVDAAITESAAEFAVAMADERNFGIAKFWMMTAIRHGVDPADGSAMNRFFEDVGVGRVDYDHEVLAHIASRHALEGGGGHERAIVQLPVSLPEEAELAAVAEQTPVVARLRALVGWVGDGRALTTTGNIRLADARELVELLDTGDTIDPRIGERVFRTKSSADLGGLTRAIDLAKKIRLVRVVKNRLVCVAKAAPLLRDGLALWTAAFDAQPALGLLARPASWAAEHTRMLDIILDEVLPDVLNTVYGLPEPMPVVRLAESVWSACAAEFYLDALDPATATRWREGVGSDLRRLLRQLAEFGAVELTVGHPDPIYRADLDSSWELDADDPAMPPDARDRLRAALAPGAGAMELVSLTPLATYAVRARLLREGRFAPLVGELSEAEPAQLLGMIAEHYSPETADAEIAGWLAAHGGRERGLPLLLDGVRGCPFRARAAVMLDVLARTAPDRSAFLRELRADRQVGPIVLQMLVADDEIDPDELDPEDGLRGMAEQFLHLLEIHGPDAVTDALADLPRAQARDVVAALQDCDHPDRTGMAELLAVAGAQVAAPARTNVIPMKGVSRSGRPRAKRKGRR